MKEYFSRLLRLLPRKDSNQIYDIFSSLPPDISSAAIINYRDEHGDTLVHHAARHHNIKALRLFLELGGDAQAVNNHGRHPIHEAIDSRECVQELAKVCDVNCMKRGDWTPAMTAAMKGRLDIVELLISFGADVNRVNRDGWNCLHLAIKEGHRDIAEYLLRISPECWKRKTRSGRLPIQTAALCGYTEIVRSILCLVKEKDRRMLLEEADNSGMGLLHVAVAGGDLVLVKELIERYELNVDIQDNTGRQPVHIAALTDQPKMIVLLMEHGAKLDARDQWDQSSPLHLAAREGHIETVQVLLQLGVDSFAKDKFGRTALDLARSWHRDAISELLSPVIEFTT
ncbi:uncharacterized protein VTP21DRAFT_3716 [Calcarisporiella thermophila]|uniref:uncharacterized protein n=1 Tax=Calcarisporiella thermophila TaxID=911321 RepID=UPI0037434911